MPGFLHEAAVAQFLKDFPDARTKGFMKEVNRIATMEGADKVRCGVYPDAFVVHPDEKTLVAVEVEDTCPVSNDKIQRYIGIWWALDEQRWSLVLLLVDKWGRVHHGVDVAELAIKDVIHQAKRRGRKPDPHWVRVAQGIRAALAAQEAGRSA